MMGVKNMNDEEFKLLEKRYYDEVNRRQNINRIKNRIADVDNMLGVLTDENPYETIVELAMCLTVTTIDGNRRIGDTNSYKVKLSKELAIKLLAQIKGELQTEIDNEVKMGE